MTTPKYPRTPARVHTDSTATRETFADLQAELQTNRIRDELAEWDRQHRDRQYFVLANDLTRSIRLVEEMGLGEILSLFLRVKKMVSDTRNAEMMADATV